MCQSSFSVKATHQKLGYRLRCLKSTPGCTDLEACNYESAANEDDGSCDYSCQNYVDPSGNGPCAKAKRRTRSNGEEYGLTEIGDPVLVPPQSGRSTAFANGEDIPLVTGILHGITPDSTASRPTACTAMTRSTPTNTGCTTTVGQRAMTAGCVPLVLLVPVNANFENLLANASENQLVVGRGLGQ